MKDTFQIEYKKILMIVVGSLLFVISMNVFLVPLQLYSGGVVGTAQLLRTIFFSNIKTFDVAGVINLCFNIPLFLLAYRGMKKNLFYGTLLSVAVQTIGYLVVPIPKAPILDDKLATILLSGVLGGIGCGIILTNGASAGGLDLLGVFLSTRHKGVSVGRMNLSYNVALYTVCAIFFDVSIALYSILFMIFFSLTVDRWHYQNIEVELMVFTHSSEVKELIMKKYIRGVTFWKGIGAYTNLETEVLVIVVAKSEVRNVKNDVLRLDPKAFIIERSALRVTGGYQKRLL